MLGLVVVSIVAVTSVIVLFRRSENIDEHQRWQIVGYPSQLVPAHELTRNGPLAALIVVQARLLSMYRQLPADSDVAIWLRMFLYELRTIMDTAYYAAQVTDAYERSPLFDWLVVEVQQIEADLAVRIAQRLLLPADDPEQELLAARLASLRMCVRELTGASNAVSLLVPR